MKVKNKLTEEICEAIQFNGSNVAEVKQFTGMEYSALSTKRIHFNTKNGSLSASTNDYFIKDKEGNITVSIVRYFGHRYEIVD